MYTLIVNRIRNAVHAVARYIRNDPQYASSLNLLYIVQDDFRRIASYSDMIIAFLRKKKREKTEELPVAAVVNEVCGFYKNILDEFNIDLIPKCDADITLNMRQVDLESIIINLITNAYAQLKVCDTNKKIIIKAWKDRDAIKIHVEDSGPGVPPEDREKIFKAFVSTKEDGIGLGLNIVRDIVKSYGGEIVCQESTTLGGACFAIDFMIGDEQNAS